MLPESRDFECRLIDDRVIRGKVDRAVNDIAAFKRDWEEVPAELTFRIISVRNNERFILMSAAEAPPGEHQPSA